MTNKLYDLDSTALTFESTVVACTNSNKNNLEGFAVELLGTCFFPEGGGQPSDTGNIDDAKVLYTYEDGERILHLCDKSLEIGKIVKGTVDAGLRLRNMQIHSGEHILSGLILKNLGLKNVGFHMGKEINTIDLDGIITPEELDEIELEVNKAITKNVPVKIYYPSSQELESLSLRKKPEVDNLRVVEVLGYDLCGCCGTHVNKTGEIGLLKIIDSTAYKGGTRLTFLCGEAALEDYRAKHKAARAISASLSCKILEAEDAVSRLIQENTGIKNQIARKNQELFTIILQDLMQTAPVILEEEKLIFLCNNNFSADEIKAFALNAAKESHVLCAAFSVQKDGIRYALSKSADSAYNLNNLCKALNNNLNGKGGGGKELCCGKAEKILSENDLKNIMSEIIK